MRILLDQNLLKETGRILRSMGHDAWHTSEIGASRTGDVDLITLAVAEDRIIVTRDTDFHQLISTRSLSGPSTILIRLPRFTDRTLAAVIDDVCDQFAESIEAGSLITVNGRGIRVRLLPIIPKLVPDAIA